MPQSPEMIALALEYVREAGLTARNYRHDASGVFLRNTKATLEKLWAFCREHHDRTAYFCRAFRAIGCGGVPVEREGTDSPQDSKVEKTADASGAGRK